MHLVMVEHLSALDEGAIRQAAELLVRCFAHIPSG